MKVIDFAKPESIPSNIRKTIEQYIEGLSQNELSQIRKKAKIENDIDVRCAIEASLLSYHAEPLHQIIQSLFACQELIFYHTTMLPITVFPERDGLKLFDWEWYSRELSEHFSQGGVPKNRIEDALALIFAECIRKGATSKEPVICCFSLLQSANTELANGYDQFCENIGGELARWALEEKMPDMLQILSKNGKRVIIKFRIPFSKLVSYQSDKVIKSVIAYYAASYFWRYTYTMDFDAATNFPVPAENVIEVIPYEGNFFNDA